MKKQMNGQKTHWLRNTLCVLIACGILGTVRAERDNSTVHCNTDVLLSPLFQARIRDLGGGRVGENGAVRGH